MSHLTDIPEELLTGEQINTFIHWCNGLAVDKATRRGIISAWQTATHTQIGGQLFNYLMHCAIDGDGIQK